MSPALVYSLLSKVEVSTVIYMETQQYPQMGTGMVNPMGVGPSGLQQNFPAGRGANATLRFTATARHQCNRTCY